MFTMRSYSIPASLALASISAVFLASNFIRRRLRYHLMVGKGEEEFVGNLLAGEAVGNHRENLGFAFRKFRSPNRCFTSFSMTGGLLVILSAFVILSGAKDLIIHCCTNPCRGASV